MLSHLIVWTTVTAVTVASLIYTKIPVYTIWSSISATVLAYVFTWWTIESLDLLVTEPDIFLYVTLFLGLIYFVVAQHLNSVLEKSHRRLVPLFFATATTFSLTAIVSLGGVWDAIAPLAIVGLMVYGTVSKSKVVLYLSSMFLVGYIVKITAVHFADSVGWPIALMIVGFLTIIIAVITFNISKKFKVVQTEHTDSDTSSQ